MLRRFVRELSSGPGALVLSGEPGMGKTDLFEEAVAVARRRSYQVLCARPAPAEIHDQYAALADLLDDVGDEAGSGMPDAPRRALDVALLRAAPTGHALEARAVAAAVRHVLTLAAEAGPVLVAVDDAQWLDAPSARALAFALRRSGTHAVGVLLGVRHDHAFPVPLGLDRIYGDHLVHLALEPMPPGPLDQLLQSRLDVPLPAEVRRRLLDASGGNPLFALEMAAAVLRLDRPLEPGDALPVPPSVRSVLEDRLDGLGEHGRQALLAAAALARPTRAVVDIAGSGAGPVAADGLGELLGAGLAHVDGDLVELAHPLLGPVVYEDTSPEERRALHARLAAALTEPEERARHLALASRGPDEEVAAALDEGARRAAGRGVPEAAATLAAEAVRCTPPTDVDAVARRTFTAADHHLAAGATALAAQLLEEVVGRSARPGPTRARALQRLGEIRAWQVGVAPAEALLAEARSGAGDDPLLRIEIDCDLAFARLLAGDLPEAARRAGAALDLARARHDTPPLVLLPALTATALGDFLLGRGVRHDLLDEAVEIEEWAARDAATHRPGSLHLPHIPATILKWSGDLDAARSRYALAHHRTTELGQESSLPWLLSQMSELECWAGNWDEAADLAARACESSERSGQRGVAGFALYARALVAGHRGEVEDAQRRAEEGLAASEAAGTVIAAELNRSVLGFLALSRGDHHRARSHLVAVREALTAMGLAEPGVVRFQADEIETLVALGLLEEAHVLAERLAAAGAGTGRAWAVAAAVRCRALLRAAQGDWEPALVELGRAAKDVDALGQPFERARFLLVEGAIRRRARQKRAAREALESALGIFEALGSRLWAERARAELSRIGGRPPAPHALTPTEERVASLVAAGWTNREVATALFMSVKTVESNLRQIFRKLGVASRRELARLDRAWPEPPEFPNSDQRDET